MNTNQLIEVLNNVYPSTIPKWGVMTPAQMFQHNSKFIDLYLGKQKVSPLLRFFGQCFGKFFLNYVKKQPYNKVVKGLKTIKSMKASDSADFEFEKQELIHRLQNIDQIKGKINSSIYGYLDAEEVRYLIHHHLKYHLFQFSMIE